jgi:hypothetical protein
MAAGSSVTWTHCSVRYEVTWGETAHGRRDASVRTRHYVPADIGTSVRTRHCIRADIGMSARTSSPALALPHPPSVPLGPVRMGCCVREDAACPHGCAKKNKKLNFFGCWLLEKRGKKMSGFWFSIPKIPQIPEFLSSRVPEFPSSPSSPSSLSSTGEAARRRRFFQPSSPSHPSKLYSSLRWLNSKVPKPFFPFTPRLIDVDGF